MAKCRICGNTLKTSDMIKIKERIYVCCDECEEKYLNPPEPITPQKEKSDWAQLMDYLKELYGGNVNYPALCTQIKRMKTEHNFTDKGIELTLRYMYDTLEMSFNDEYGLGLIVYYYQQTKQFYQQKKEIKRAVDDVDWNDDIVVIKKNVDKKNITNDDISDL
jgi:hypothetical protein